MSKPTFLYKPHFRIWFILFLASTTISSQVRAEDYNKTLVSLKDTYCWSGSFSGDTHNSLSIEIQNISENNKKILKNNQYKKMLDEIDLGELES